MKRAHVASGKKFNILLYDGECLASSFSFKFHLFLAVSSGQAAQFLAICAVMGACANTTSESV
jgi:hypothetical protein